MNGFSEPELRAFKTFFHKGPVWYSGSQRSADNAFQIIRKHLTEGEKRKITIARGHAVLCNESRREFDFVCGEIRDRLGLPRQ